MNPCTGIQQAKRVAIKKIETDIGFKFELNYFQTDKTRAFTPIMKKNSKISMLILPGTCENTIELTKNLQIDLAYLMERRFGAQWRVQHTFYAGIIASNVSKVANEEEAEEEDLIDNDLCDCNVSENILL